MWTSRWTSDEDSEVEAEDVTLTGKEARNG